MTIPLINVLPITQNLPSQRAQILASNKINKLKVANTPDELIDAIVVSQLLANEYEQALASSQTYTAAKTAMPNLRQVPELRKYRTTYPNFCHSILEIEINNHGDILAKGQILYHGGTWPCTGNSILTNKVLSTSLSPQVAMSHGAAPTVNQIWKITISSNYISAFVFNDVSNQSMAHEKEVLLSSNVTLTVNSIRVIGKFEVLDVTAT